MSVHAIAPAHDQIAALAHKLWEDEGRPEGRAEAHWLRATAELTAPKAPAAKAKAPAKKAAKAK